MNSSDALDIVDFVLSKIINFRNLTQESQAKIKKFLRKYHNDVYLLPNACMAAALDKYEIHKYKRDMYNDFCELVDQLSFEKSFLSKSNVPIFDLKFIKKEIGSKNTTMYDIYKQMIDNITDHWKQNSDYDDANDRYIYRLYQDTSKLLNDVQESIYPLLAYQRIPEFQMCNFRALDNISRTPETGLAQLTKLTEPNYMISSNLAIYGVFQMNDTNKLQLIFNSPVIEDNKIYDQSGNCSGYPMVSGEVQAAIACWTNYYLASYATKSDDCFNTIAYITERPCCLEDLWLMSTYMLYIANLHLLKPKQYSKLIK